MASRKEQKVQLRARREELERERAVRARRTRRLYMLGAAAAAAIAFVAVVLAVSSSGGGKHGIQKGAAASKTVSSVTSLLRGIPQSGSTLGNASAPVTMEYYGDLECPICRDFTLGTMPQVIADQVRTGKLQVQYRALETATRDPQTFLTQQVAALAAGRQNRMWQFVELFYHQQGAEGTGYVTENFLQRIADQVPGLNVAAWKRARASTALANQVSADAAAASQAKANATPTLVIAGRNGTRSLSGDVPYGDIVGAIKAVS
jgi:protein-disulfide isomerase